MLNTQLLAFRKSTLNQPSVRQYNCSNRSLCLRSLNVFNEGTIKVTIASAYPFNSNIEKRQQMIASEGTISLAKIMEIRNRNVNEFIEMNTCWKFHRSVNSFNQKPIFQHVNSRSKHTFFLVKLLPCANKILVVISFPQTAMKITWKMPQKNTKAGILQVWLEPRGRISTAFNLTFQLTK